MVQRLNKGEYHLQQKKEYSVSTVCVAPIEGVEDDINNYI
jgi:hypothetical protein